MATPKQGTQDWLDWRKTKIGGSDAPIIMGCSPWNTPYQLWRNKMGLDPEKDMTAAMQKGKDLEKYVLAKVNQEYNLFMSDDVIESAEHPWRIASLDGKDRDQIVEIKVSETGYKTVKDGIVPIDYYWQCMHNMAVCRLGSMLLAVYSDAMDDVAYDVVLYNHEHAQALFEKEMLFYGCMQSGQPPEMTDKDYQDMSQDEAFDILEREWLQDEQMAEEAIAKRDISREKLIAYCQRPSVGKRLRICKFERKGNIDYSAIEEIRDLDLEKYRKKSTTVWQIKKM